MHSTSAKERMRMTTERVTIDSILKYLADAVEERKPIPPERWIDGASKLNVLLGDLIVDVCERQHRHLGEGRLLHLQVHQALHLLHDLSSGTEGHIKVSTRCLLDDGSGVRTSGRSGDCELGRGPDRTWRPFQGGRGRFYDQNETCSTILSADILVRAQPCCPRRIERSDQNS